MARSTQYGLQFKVPYKVRNVHDCAATANGKSLINFLIKGADLMNSLVGVLLRFQKEKFFLETTKSLQNYGSVPE